MAPYRIVCTDQSNPPAPGHGHIIAVGIGSDPDAAEYRQTVEEVRNNLAHGDVYFTKGPRSGKTAYVEAWTCGCGVRTIRSKADAVTDNNLDNLRLCSWKR